MDAPSAHDEHAAVLFTHHPQAIWRFEPGSLRVLAGNRAALRLYGSAPRGEVNLVDLAAPACADDFHAYLAQAVAETTPAQVFAHRRAGGGSFDAEVRISRIDEVAYAMIDDVTSIGRAHRLVVGQNVLLEAIARGEGLGQVLTSLVEFAERELPGLLGSVLLLDEAGLHVRHGAAPSLPAAYTSAIDGAAIGPSAGSCGTAAYHGVQIIVPDIRLDPRWDGYRDFALPHGLVACWSTPIRSASGRVLGTFALYYGEPRSPTAEELGFIEVITAVARLAIERDHAARTLLDSEARYRAIFDNDMTGDLVSDAQGTVVECNAAFARTFGFPGPAEVRGVREASFFTDVAAREAILTRLRREKSLSSLELELRRGDGQPVHVLANALGSFDAEGQLARVSWYFLDRTAQKQLEEQVRHAQKMEAVGLLAAGVAHDFNNLLTVINSYSEMLMRRPAPPASWQEMVGEIRDAGERAATLTSQLLALGRRQVLAPAPVDLNELVAGVDRILRRLIGEDLEIVVELAADLGKVFADRGQLEQVLLNLALNARDAMPTGGTIRIRTHLQHVDARAAAMNPGVAQGRHAALSVSDTGGGMDDETRARIFEPFFTTKGVGKGTGLGLAIVYGIVRQSGGFIDVESSGRGTSFTVCLPVCEEPLASFDRHARPVTVTTGHETVLLVEDEERIRQLCRKVLCEQGYHVLEAGNGVEAVAVSADHPVDLLVTDVVMPQMNGRELADRLRVSRPDLKVLYISGYTDDAIVRRGVTQDSASLLPKPFTPNLLLRRVREVLDRS